MARTVYRFSAGKSLDQIGITGRTEGEGTRRGVSLVSVGMENYERS